MRRNLLFKDDSGESAGEPAKTGSLDLATKVKLPDGKEIAIGDLVQTYSKHGELSTQMQDMQQFRQNVAAAFSTSTAPEKREAAVRDLLVSLGHSKADVDQYLAGLQGGGEEEEEVEEDEDDVRLQALEQRLQAMHNDSRKSRSQQLNKDLSAAIVATIGGEKELQHLLGLTEKRGGDKGKEARQETESKVMKYVDGTVRAAIRSRIDRGEQFHEGMFKEEAAKAVADYLSPLRSAIGDVATLGRTPETVAEHTILKNKPAVKAPDYKPGMDKAELDKQVGDWLADSLTRDAAEVASEAESAV